MVNPNGSVQNAGRRSQHDGNRGFLAFHVRHGGRTLRPRRTATRVLAIAGLIAICRGANGQDATRPGEAEKSATTAATGKSATSAPSKKVAIAREMLGLWAGGKNEEIAGRCAEQMRKGFGAPKFAQAWASAEFQYGAYRSEIAAEETAAGGFTAVRFTLKFERATLKIRFVLDGEDRLSGLWFDDVKVDEDRRMPPYAKADAFREEKVVVKCGEFELPGTISWPASATSKAASAAGSAPSAAAGKNLPSAGAAGAARLAGVVLVHGSGPHDQDESLGPNKVFRDIAAGLATRGVAVLRYEKRTKKYGAAMKPEDVTLEWEVIDDAVAAAELLRGRTEIDAKRVFVMGHSLGGFAAPMIAQRDGKLAGIVLMAGNSRPLLDLVEEQLTFMAGLDGGISDDEKAELDKVRKTTAAIRAGRLEDAPAPLLGVDNAYWLKLHKIDQVAAARELKIPMLVVQGGKDYQVTKADFAGWKKALGDRKNVAFRFYDDLTHLFMPGAGIPGDYQKPGFVDERLVKDVAEWIEGIASGE